MLERKLKSPKLLVYFGDVLNVPSAPFEEDPMEGSRPPAESPEYLRELEGYEAN